MIETMPSKVANVLAYRLSEKLHDKDYQKFVPEVDAAVKAQGKVRFLLQMEDFHGWDLHAAWDDFCLGLKHFKDFDRIAMVGDRKWEKAMTDLWKPFTLAKVKYFDISEIDTAWAWLGED